VHRRVAYLFFISAISISSCDAKQIDCSYSESPPLPMHYFSQNRGTESPLIESLSGPLKLSDALSLALLKNPMLEVFSLEVRAAEAREIQAGFLPNPELEIDVEDFGRKGAESTLAIGQLIELGGKREKRKRVASLSKQLEDWNYESKRLDIFTGTSRAFVEVLTLQQRLILAKETLELAKRMHNLVSEKVEVGKVSPLEKIKADVLLSTSQIVEDGIAKQLESSRRVLASYWGASSPEFTNVEGDLETISTIPPLETLSPLISQNPDIIRFETELQLRQSEIRLAEAKRIPNVTIRGGVTRFESTRDYGFMVAISAPLGIFNRNQGGIEEAKHNMASTFSLKNSEEIRIKTELSSTYQELSSAHYQAITFRNSVLPAATNALEASSEGYRQGKLEYLDVLDAQRTLYEVKSSYIQSLSVYHKATIEVERLIGQRINKEISHVR
jgi:cobalt-zinc-cadmium efflux system outer membrane protein